MAEWMLLPDGVSKSILHAGKGDLPDFPDDSKVVFHYKTLYEREGKEIVLDDSKRDKYPFELLMGKKFKLEIWETLIKTMRVDEVASFTCAAKHCGSYPVVSKSMRDINKKKHKQHDHHDHHHEDEHPVHQCGYAALTQGLGHADLDDYVKEPAALTFILELVRLTLPGDYEPDIWSLSLEEKLQKLPEWKEQGNEYYKKGEYDQASKMYSQAIGSLEQLMTREKPGTDDYTNLDLMKVPYLLNFSQCLLEKKEYYQAITHLTTVMEKDENNVKGLYRRAKAYQSVYKFNSARGDYKRVKELDSSLVKTVDKELSKIDHEEKKKNLEDKKKYMNAFSTL